MEEQFKVATLVSNEPVTYKKLPSYDVKNEILGPGAANVSTVVATPFLLCLNDVNKYKGKRQLQTTALHAYRGMPEPKLVFLKPARWCKALFADLRRSIETYLDHMPHMSRGCVC